LDVFDNAWTFYKAPEKEEALKKEADAFRRRPSILKE